jgi:hypothetical protein
MSGPGSSSWMISREFKDEKYWQICCMLLWYMLIFYVRQCRHNRQHPVHTWNVTRQFFFLIESDTIEYGIIVIVGVKYEHDHLSRVKSRMLMALGPKDQSSVSFSLTRQPLLTAKDYAHYVAMPIITTITILLLFRRLFLLQYKHSWVWLIDSYGVWLILVKNCLWFLFGLSLKS